MGFAYIDKKIYDQLKRLPLFFLKKEKETFYDDLNHERVSISWKPLNSMFTNVVAGKITSNLSYVLMIIDGEVKLNQNEYLPKDKIKVSIHEASPSSDNDWIIVLQSIACRNQNGNDRLFFIYLLWFLGNTNWSEDKFYYNLCRYDKQYLLYFLKNLQKIGRCLSIEKQNKLRSVFIQLNQEYQVYAPAFIDDTFKTLFPDKEPYCDRFNIFYKINEILVSDTNVSISENNKNSLLRLREWLKGNDMDVETSFIEKFYSFLSPNIQTLIIKRYFHDICRKKHIFDPAFIESLKENKYIIWQYYRYSLYTPEGPIVLTNTLLCDLILTLHESKGKSFVTFNGVLDLALRFSNVVRPKIDIGMESFLPSCNGGAKVNPDFNGFIDYSIVYEYNPEKFTDEVVLTSIRECLDKWARHKTYYTCRYSTTHEPLKLEQVEKCRTHKCFNQMIPECLVLNTYDDIWQVRGSDYTWLNTLVENQYAKPENESEKSKIFDVSFKQTSIKRHRDFILSIIANLPKKDGKLVVSSSSLQDNNVLFILGFKEIFIPVSMQIIPQKDCFLGIDFDIHGIASRLRSQLSNVQNSNIHSLNNIQEQNKLIRNEFIMEEQKVVYEKLVTELKKRLGSIDFVDGRFEVPYDKILLDTILKEFYSTHTKVKNGEEDKKLKNREEDKNQFLTCGRVGKYSQFCAPTKAENNNRAIGIPFFWCKGKECFRNALGSSTLETCSDWTHYQLFHLIEIIGFPKIIKTDAGNEPDKSIRSLIGTVNKAMRKFERLRCRSCGHLLFSCGESNFGRRNLYHCINPSCPEHNVEVYLNYCFHCKTGLIDSRDSAKCPNGSVICPSCLSCCDDDHYEKLAQNYIVDHKAVPYFIQSKRGHGHNNNGLFFCPTCGNELYIDPEGNYTCVTCQKIINLYRISPGDIHHINE